MRVEGLDRLDVLGRHGRKVAGAPVQQIGRRQLLQFVEQTLTHLGQQLEREVVCEPRFEPVQHARERCRHGQRQEQAAVRVAGFDGGDDQCGQHTHAD